MGREAGRQSAREGMQGRSGCVGTRCRQEVTAERVRVGRDVVKLGFPKDYPGDLVWIRDSQGQGNLWEGRGGEG